ncbi:HTH-type transcriptional regulator GltC [Cupriavidus yeoncheonensis]|uniref:HTH-type transcriptional regulator GltC n=1 Tax=Cupriavidus yeoncheonensis TaxID=1462994 RepID=A0A916IRH5_9BURK|nr:LysR family transcriptional regulator [Cupriavidus yeoncheonensis]CAG2129606.1 HTH-type transcriptional regulator GltC [Cupriavidus yeoncheonensis]
MDLRRLNHVIALADTLHFARAAEQVHLSQPAFSRSIQAIESDLGVRLFERDAGGIRPTPAGEFVLERARRLLFEARCMQRDVALYRDTQLGDTAFGVGPFPAVTLMPRVLSELRRQHPQVSLRVEESNWVLLLERLRAEDIEFFVADVRDLPEDASLDVRPLPGQSARFFVRVGHPLAGAACTIAEAWQYGVAGVKAPRVVKAAFSRALGLPAGQQAVLALECDDFAVIRAVTLSTDMVLGATDASVRAELASGELVALDVEGLPAMKAGMGIVSLRNRTPSPMAVKAIRCVERVAAEISGERDASPQ